MKCSTKIVTQLQKDCKPQETIMVGTTLQNMLSAYEGVCKYIIISKNWVNKPFLTKNNNIFWNLKIFQILA